MATIKCIYALYLAAARLVYIDYSHCTRTFTQSISGHSCAKDYNIGQASSSIQCSLECDKISTCNSFDYNAVTGACFGSFTVYTNSIGCTVSSPELHYKAVDIALGTSCAADTDCPLQFSVCAGGLCECGATSNSSMDGTQCILISTYGFPCASSIECIDTNTECWAGRCECTPGYSLIPFVNQCVETCSSYGTTYIKYVNYDLSCSSSSDFYEGIAIVDCLAYCSANPTCLSMSFHNGMGACQIRYCDPMTDPNGFHTYLVVDTYVRNCL